MRTNRDGGNNPKLLAIGLSATLLVLGSFNTISTIPRDNLQMILTKDNANNTGKDMQKNKVKYMSIAAKNSWEEISMSYTAEADGELQVLVANESPNNIVYFDDVEVKVQNSLIVQSTHYDPWGVELAGIEKTGQPEHDYQYNGKEMVDDLGLNLDMEQYRFYAALSKNFFQIDPRPYDGEILCIGMADNPIMFSDNLEDTIKFANETTRQFVESYTQRMITRKNDKVAQNKNYSEAFATIISQLDAAPEIFNFTDDVSTKTGGEISDSEGEFNYDGTQFNVIIGEPKEAYGGGKGGLMFEEVYHAKQFLDGKVYFGKFGDGKWYAQGVDVQDEYEAKKFALGTDYNLTFIQYGYNVPTQLGVIAKSKNEFDVHRYLIYGGIFSVTNAKYASLPSVKIIINGAYPNLKNPSGTNSPYQKKTVTPTIYAYPYRK